MNFRGKSPVKSGIFGEGPAWGFKERFWGSQGNFGVDLGDSEKIWRILGIPGGDLGNSEMDLGEFLAGVVLGWI